mmetsp:Transcript_103014/g.279923  ORF Transcript_103014/g.279923 Transcript_103014/m.279923 type:complete len:232 (+) Transcript_103014:30-725(+)
MRQSVAKCQDRTDIRSRRYKLDQHSMCTYVLSGFGGKQIIRQLTSNTLEVILFRWVGKYIVHLDLLVEGWVSIAHNKRQVLGKRGALINENGVLQLGERHVDDETGAGRISLHAFSGHGRRVEIRLRCDRLSVQGTRLPRDQRRPTEPVRAHRHGSSFRIPGPSQERRRQIHVDDWLFHHGAGLDARPGGVKRDPSAQLVQRILARPVVRRYDDIRVTDDIPLREEVVEHP